MKKFLIIFFVTLGVIFFALIFAALYVYIFDPFHLRQTFVEETGSATSTVSTDKNPALSPAQEKALETFGIDAASVPSSITPAQEACFTAELGAERVAEIKAGDMPTPAEFFKAKSCVGL